MARSLGRWSFVLCLAALASCATRTRVEPTGASYGARERDCDVAFFEKSKPGEPFETLGKVESHIARNFFLGGKAKLRDEGFAELRSKACGLGGNAVIIDDHLETAASEMTHLHVWATVIRLPGTSASPPSSGTNP